MKQSLIRFAGIVTLIGITLLTTACGQTNNSDFLKDVDYRTSTVETVSP